MSIFKFVFRAAFVTAIVGLFASSSLSAKEPKPGPERVALPPAEKREVDFAKDVQPIFANHCYKCHGPEKQESGLRLHRKQDAFSGGDNGRAFLPGNSAGSHLVQLVATDDKDHQMPPPDKGERLTPTQIGVLRAWIDQGAKWPDIESAVSDVKHWAYEKPVRKDPPVVKNKSWPRSPIDQFVLAKLEAEGLSPSPELEKERLIRRVSLDLTGLPPTPAEVDAFVSDTSPDAYDKVVNRLLQSPHYGERWALPWLDLARYADTSGYEKDPQRTIWPYRDWVIDQLNRDLPFDQFTIEQMAGDLLPDSTNDQKVATGFHRNSMVNTEGGVDGEEYRLVAVVDRINTIGTVWLGSTLNCCQCHSHKYDPFKQKEYYQLLAFFNQTAESGTSTNVELAVQPHDFEHPDAKPPEKPAPEKLVKTLVLKEVAKPRETFVHLGGNFMAKGDRVTPGVPAILPPFPQDAPPNRLSFAKWLVSPENPLTARVAVNRAWEQFFGTGIVATSEDFGTRGERPTHPELLDWLATEFIQQGWSQKSLHRLIVSSATYRQSGAVSAKLLEKDPANRLLARGPRLRLPAELIRDQALSTSGLLSQKIGGPSVMPLQPEGIWARPYSGERWKPSDGANRHRRGMYTFWRRTAPYPSFMSFDAPSREVCVARRPRTNTPLQALTVLNDPVYFEAAQGLARRMMTETPGKKSDENGSSEPGPTDRERVEYGFRLCLSRRPTATELARIEGLFQAEKARFQNDIVAAKAIVGSPTDAKLDPPTLAAWTIVANVLLNLDEFLTRG